MIYAVAIAAMTICVILFVWVWRTRKDEPGVITPFLLFSIIEIVVNWPAAFFAPMVGDARDLLPLVYLLVGFLMFLGGVLVVRNSIPISAGKRNISPQFIRVLSKPPRRYIVGSLVLVALLAPLSLWFYQGMPPILDSIASLVRGQFGTEDAVSLGLDRRYLTKGHYFGEDYRGQGLLRTVIRVGWPYLVGVTITIYSWYKRRVWLISALVWFIASFIFIAGEGTRGPFMYSLVYMTILISLISPLKPRHIVAAGIAGMSVMIGMSLISNKLHWIIQEGESLDVAIDHVIHRVFYGNGVNTAHTIELIRDGVWDYRLGEIHLQRFMSALPGVQWGVPFSHQLYLAMNPMGSATTFSSATYFADIYTDFGFIGVIIIYFYIGMGVESAGVYLSKLPHTPFGLPMVAYIIFAIGFIPVHGIIGVITGIAVICILYALPLMAHSLLSSTRH